MAMPVREPDRTFRFGPFVLELWVMPGQYADGRVRYAFRFFDDQWSPAPVFERWDYKSPEWQTYEEVALSVLEYVATEGPDVRDPYFFRDYTLDQILWRDFRAPMLKAVITEEERGRRRRMAGRKKSHR